MYGFETVAAITVICFLVAEGIKLTPLNEKWLPIICGALGGILGIICMKFLPSAMPASDWITAIAIGIESGLAATGGHQIFKQLTKDEE